MGFYPKCCDNTASTPDSEASTSTTSGLEGSGCLSMGDVVKNVLSLVKASPGIPSQVFGVPLEEGYEGVEIDLKP